MDHRAFLKTLSGEQKQQLTLRNNNSALIRLCVLLVCFAFSSSALFFNLPLLGVWVLIQGLLLVSLFHLMHECVHDTVFKQRLPNRILAHVCGFLLFLPAIWFRYFHHAHHRYTHQQDNDPELATARPQNRWQWFVHIVGFPVWRSQLELLFNSLIKPVREPYLKENKQAVARAEMLLMLGAYAFLLMLSVLTGSTILLFLWIIPLIIGQPFLRLYLLAEHTGCEHDSNMLNNTRTVLTNPLVRWFTWNMPYHAEHHVYPTVPFHQLPRLHTLMKTYVSNVEPSYTTFNRLYFKQMIKTQ